MKSFIDSIQNLVQSEQPHVLASPTGTHQPDATQAASSPPVVVDPTVDHPEPDLNQFQTPIERIPAPILESKGYVGAARPADSPLNRLTEVSDEEEGAPLIKKRRVMPLGSGGPASRVQSARSQSSGPHAIVGATRFHTFAAQSRQFIVHAGFQRTLTDVEVFDVEVVQEFWAHLPSVKSEDVSVRVWLRGHECEFSPARVNALFGLPDVDYFVFLEHDVRDMRSLVRICGTNWSPTMNPFYKNRNRLMLLYRLGNGIPFNFGKLVVDHVLSVARSSVAKLYLPFPSLICRLLAAQRPVERLQDVVSPHLPPEEVVEPEDIPDQATASSGPSSTNLQRAIRLAIQILEVALTGGDEVEKEEESMAKNKGKRKAA
ncbi:hypothetical protein AALP_AA8G264200 [Arabis alpina]|uniref:Putative plant transposon protein domain-containing protein n=1 Tax=Arabis alpina TaxID=50452 RepID=A0A087G9K6_ARAAL|nr:hypothetical protein AALP_AA8G264200 [Arabis alpina]